MQAYDDGVRVISESDMFTRIRFIIILSYRCVMFRTEDITMLKTLIPPSDKLPQCTTFKNILQCPPNSDHPHTLILLTTGEGNF